MFLHSSMTFLKSIISEFYNFNLRIRVYNMYIIIIVIDVFIISHRSTIILFLINYSLFRSVQSLEKITKNFVYTLFNLT